MYNMYIYIYIYIYVLKILLSIKGERKKFSKT